MLHQDPQSSSTRDSCLHAHGAELCTQISAPTKEIQLSDVADLVHSSYPRILELCSRPSNYEHEIVEANLNGVMDRKTFELAETLKLFKADNRTVTTFGAATLLRSYRQPLVDEQLIREKQSASVEIETRPQLIQALQDILEVAAKHDKKIVEFLEDNGDAYAPYRGTRTAIRKICELAEHLPEPNSKYLKVLFDDIKALTNSTSHQLSTHWPHRTLRGVVPAERAWLPEPRLPFTASYFSYETYLPWAGYIAAKIAATQGLLDPVRAEAAAAICFNTGAFMAALCVLGAKFFIDAETGVKPVRRKMRADDKLKTALEAIGKLDELMSFFNLHQELRYQSALNFPHITNSNRHSFIARDLRNPYLLHTLSTVVPNSFHLGDRRVVAITGPNSVGKTTIVKAVVQNQIKAQIGDRVTCSQCCLSIAERIAFQAPAYDNLDDKHGYYGTELCTTKTFTFRLPVRSLVILDEFANGTTEGEGRQKKKEILAANAMIGRSILWITHDHKTVTELANIGIAHPIMGLVQNEKSTKEFTEGVSTHSHAELVAKDVGFATSDIEQHLRRTGAMNEHLWHLATRPDETPASAKTPPNPLTAAS